jgi:hypothetical protein
VGIDEGEGGSGSSYYAVSSVDSGGDESAQSLGISPATLASAAGAAAGCFVGSVADSGSYKILWVLIIFTLTLVIATGIRHRASGGRQIDCGMRISD